MIVSCSTRVILLAVAMMFTAPLMSALSAQRILGETISLGAALSGYYGDLTPLEVRVARFSSDMEAEDVVRRILQAVTLAQNFEIRATWDVPNAAAGRCHLLEETERRRLCSSSDNDRLLLYNPDFMEDMRRRTGSEWPGISIMAHEVGHHLNDHTIDRQGTYPAIELEADRFSGGVLHKLGASLRQAQAAISTFPERGSDTHPRRRERLRAISEGWRESRELVGPRRDLQEDERREEEARRRREADMRRRLEEEEARRRWQRQSNTCQTSVGVCRSQGTWPVGAQCTCTWFNAFGQWITYPGIYVQDR